VASDRPPRGDGPTQWLADGRVVFRTRVPGLGLAPAAAAAVDDAVAVTERSLTNDSLVVTIDDTGALASVRSRAHDRELIPAGGRGAALELAPDHPVEFDAWDLESWTRRAAIGLDGAASIEVVDGGPLVGSVRVERRFGRSTVRQTYVLRAGSGRLDVELDIDWHEDEHLLSMAFPLAVRADTAGGDVQFGIAHRPTHTNTSWDAAKFEVCAHRFVDVSEPSFGVAVLNDGRYGHAVQASGPDSAVRVSLLRAAKFPDPLADRGRHRVTLALLPHGSGLREVVAEAEVLNLPVRIVDGAGGAPPPPVVTVDHPGVLVSAVKRADDGSGDLVVRLYEACGDRAAVRVTTLAPMAAAWRCSLLEDREEQVDAGADGVTLSLRPFELVTLRVSPDQVSPPISTS
jgi:alpha-mannosidase